MQQNFAPNVPLSSRSGTQPDPEGTEGFILPSVTAKVINPDRRSDYKNYLIRDVHSNDVQSLNGVKTLLQEELGERAPTSFDFDVGFYRGNKQVWMRSDNDVKEFLSILKEKPECVLWCMGRSTKKRSRDHRNSSEESDACHEVARKSKKKKTTYEDKQEMVDDTVDELRSKHGTKFTSLQYRVWAETILSGSHESLDDPPRGSFFGCKGQVGKKAACSNVSSQQPASPTSSHSQPTGLSLTPGKTAELRSTYIKQIKELHDLLEMGAITQEHFTKQRDSLLEQMDKLN